MCRRTSPTRTRVLGVSSPAFFPTPTPPLASATSAIVPLRRHPPAHPFLKRSSTAAEVQAFKRRVPPRPAQTNKRRVSNGADEDHTMPSLSPSPSVQASQGHTYQSPPDPPVMYQSRHLGSVGENEPASFPFNPSFGSSYPPPVHQRAAFRPPSRPVYYLTESSSGSDFGGSLPNRTPYLGSLSDRIPPSLQGPAGIPLPPGSSTSSVFMPSLPHGHSLTHRGPGLAFPQTAPPHASSFPELAKITQGHIRTRSVQGEPPSATLLSPIDPGDPTWDNYQPDPHDPILRIGGDVPTYDLSNTSTWFRRGYNNIHTGQPVSPPPGQEFVPTLLSPDPPSAGFDSSHQGQGGPTLIASTPRAMPIRSERDRRTSINSSPYSPRSRPSPELSLCRLSSFGRGRSGSRGRASASVAITEKRAIGGDRMDVEVEDLPSASVRFRHPELFDGMLKDGPGMIGQD